MTVQLKQSLKFWKINRPKISFEESSEIDDESESNNDGLLKAMLCWNFRILTKAAVRFWTISG